MPFFILIFFSLLNIFSDVIVLKGGKTHEGQVIKFDNNELTIKIQSGKTILEKKDIKSIHFGINKEQFLTAKKSEPVKKETMPPKEPIKKEVTLSKGVIEIKQPYHSKNFDIKIKNAEIGQVALKGFMSKSKITTDKYLKLFLLFSNTSERKILSFDGGDSKFSMKDDVENTIRRITVGFSQTVVGALKNNTEINPKKSNTHLVIFKVPPPKTQFLILTVNLNVFGDTGFAKLNIPASKIYKFKTK